MDSSLKLFLIGIAVGTSALILSNIADAEELWNNPGNYFAKFLYLSGTTWIIIFMIIIITTLPFVAIEPLKKRFTRKSFLPFPFLAGNGFAFLSLQLIAIILEAIR